MADPLRTYTSPQATLAALCWLWQHRVCAWVERINARQQTFPTVIQTPFPIATYRLHVPSTDRERSNTLLQDFDTELKGEVPIHEHWAERPALQLLSPELAPPCPKCGRVLALDADLNQCPACDTQVNVEELVVDLHGPEVLVDAYESEPILDDSSAMAVPAHCSKCDYVLLGLGITGKCPECGSDFNKDEIVRSWFM